MDFGKRDESCVGITDVTNTIKTNIVSTPTSGIVPTGGFHIGKVATLIDATTGATLGIRGTGESGTTVNAGNEFHLSTATNAFVGQAAGSERGEDTLRDKSRTIVMTGAGNDGTILGEEGSFRIFTGCYDTRIGCCCGALKFATFQLQRPIAFGGLEFAGSNTTNTCLNTWDQKHTHHRGKK